MEFSAASTAGNGAFTSYGGEGVAEPKLDIEATAKSWPAELPTLQIRATDFTSLLHAIFRDVAQLSWYEIRLLVLDMLVKARSKR